MMDSSLSRWTKRRKAIIAYNEECSQDNSQNLYAAVTVVGSNDAISLFSASSSLNSTADQVTSECLERACETTSSDASSQPHQDQQLLQAIQKESTGDCIYQSSEVNVHSQDSREESYITGTADSFDEYLDNESSSEESLDLKELLSKWAKSAKLSNSELAELLKILRNFHPDLPKDPRSLRETPTNIQTINLAGGQYYHFGLQNAIELNLDTFENELLQCDEILLQVNIDGLPLFKSTPGQFWPILGMVSNLPVKYPFIIGLYYGLGKPTNINEYLSMFLADLFEVLSNGLNCFQKCFKLSLMCFICDAPARAFLKNIKQHTGYNSCERCTVEGAWVNKVVFDDFRLLSEVMKVFKA